jgi:hypothetical protein
MKQSQWIVAVLILAVMVFAVTFSMNYLGGPSKPPSPDGQSGGIGRELLFAMKAFPPPAPDGTTMALQREDRSTGAVDYWFHNPEAEPVKLGLQRKSCKCAAVEAFILPEDGALRLAVEAAALCGVAAGGPLGALAFHERGLASIQEGVRPTELMQQAESVEVPGGAIGWVRLRYHGERAGPQALGANLWMDSQDTNGKSASLDLRLVFLEPVRVRPLLQVETLRDQDLAKGVTRYIECWSSTRSSLDLKAKVAVPRGHPDGDPFLVGQPEPLDEANRRRLENQNNAAGAGATPLENLAGPVLCAYRIPVTLLAVAPDGKTPFDLGPFRRRVLIECRQPPTEPKSVVVVGRVRGLVDLGSDDDGAGEITFESFRSSQGKRGSLGLHTDVPGLKLEVDRTRTWQFLNVNAVPKPAAGGRQSWLLRVEVKPGVRGNFPRKDDPQYEDCAVYLNATAPGQKPRAIRIAVRGTASGGD